jgi:hypothetical protein
MLHIGWLVLFYSALCGLNFKLAYLVKPPFPLSITILIQHFRKFTTNFLVCITLFTHCNFDKRKANCAIGPCEGHVRTLAYKSAQANLYQYEH